MSKGRHAFKQGDITKAARGAVKAGLNVQRVEIDKSGKIVVFVGGEPPSAQTNEWDDVR
jgi:nickel-dependent lactate racemase